LITLTKSHLTEYWYALDEVLGLNLAADRSWICGGSGRDWDLTRDWRGCGHKALLKALHWRSLGDRADS